MAEKQETSSHSEMTFFEHLDELRPHLVRGGLAILVFMLAAFLARTFVVDVVLMGPQTSEFPINRFFDYLAEKWDMPAIRLNDYSLEMINTTMVGQFNMHLKISMVVGLVFAIPYAIWELWRFIKPALTDDELKNSRMFVFYVSLCFFCGVAFGYFLLVPISINFFAGYVVSPDIQNLIDIGSYLSMVVSLSLACGIVFQLPLLIYFLARMGIMSSAFMRKYRRHAIMVLLVFSAIITPPDPFSLILVVLPLYALYELGILIAQKVERKKAAQEDAEAGRSTTLARTEY